MARKPGSKDKTKRKKRLVKSKKVFKKYYFASKDNPSKVRNTAILADSLKRAKEKLRRPRPENAIVHSIEKMTPAEIKTAQAGRWVLTRPGGISKGKAKKTRGYGPKPK